ncbi:apoptosis antagonizing transcription factor [Megachile rotundata]|uniref:apoptosis antagonizing transcription factor n=1 Tax=Megachile rotundata TaxID=143995 RepID=UPI000258EDE7|nr:PREDICTED: protein AATF [Megachile rotundata]
MALKGKEKSLADKINSLVTPTPTNFDSDDEAEDTKAKVIEHESDESDNSKSNFEVSELRKRNIDPLDQIDERYKGKKVSRKDVYHHVDDFNSYNSSESMEESDDDVSDNDIDDENDDHSNENVENYDDSDYENEENSNESDNLNELSNDRESDFEQHFGNKHKVTFKDKNSSDDISTQEEKDFRTMTHTNVKADIDKGNCVRSQLKLWESLLEIRIKLQKCLTTSNQMPQYDVYKNFKTNAEYTKKADEAKSKLKTLLNNMLQLQNFLLKQYPETKNLLTQNNKRKTEENIDEEQMDMNDSLDEEIPSDTEDENEAKNTLVSTENVADCNEYLFRKKMKLNDYEKILNENHKSYSDYRNSVIQKWNEKTKIATGKLEKNMNESTLKQIEFALSDKEKARKKSRLKRSEYKIIGKIEAEDDNDGRRIQEHDSEIYDDDDFYHQLLRDLIEYKSSDITDPIQLSKQWIQLQNMRSKIKRKIDTRATKGRRIRYNVHNKLVNFMAPITVNDTWTDHAKDELYSSLFGKIKPTNREVNN